MLTQRPENKFWVLVKMHDNIISLYLPFQIINYETVINYAVAPSDTLSFEDVGFLLYQILKHSSYMSHCISFLHPIFAAFHPM